MSIAEPAKIITPWADTGSKNPIPQNSNNATGAAGYDKGFPDITMTPPEAGGNPPAGQDFNGIFYEVTNILRYMQAGGQPTFDAALATAIGGYPKGARIMRTDGTGYWLNTVENNVTDPEDAGAAAAGWVPDFTNGVANVPMASANVTLTPAQYGKPTVLITGTLTANLNLIFPAIEGAWTLINNATGAFSITAKTASGTGAVIAQGFVGQINGDGTNIYSRAADFSNTVDMGKGVALIGGAGRVVNSISALKSLPKTGSPSAFVVGYYAPGDGGGGAYYYDSVDTTSADNGGTIIVATDGGRWKLTDQIKIDIRQFGVVGDGATNNTARLQAVRDYLATAKTTLVIPGGVYSYSVSPNWNIPYLRIEIEGEVRFRYTGTGNAFIIDDSALVGLYGLFIGPRPIIIEAPSTAQNGVYIKSVHHSELWFNVRGAGATYSGMRIDFAVCSSFPNFTVSNNENGGAQGWYLGAKPKYALYLDERNPGETASYCLFENPILEGTTKGAYLDHAMGNIFVGGTMEGCTEQGAYLTANAFANKWYGTDFEANTIHDIYCLGRQNQFSDIDTLYLLSFDGNAHDNRVLGGNHNQISMVGTTYANQIGNLVVNREGAGGTVTDLNTSNRIYNIRDAVLGLNYNRPPTSLTVGVGASPFTYTNSSGQDVDVAVGGGVVSQIIYGRPANSSAIFVGTVGKWKLCPGDTLEVTYSVVPTIVVFSS